MQKKIMAFMEEHHMAKEGDCILAGVSGGADSICLLSVLLELAKEKKYRICAVHVEHGIRGEASGRDASFVERHCRERGVPLRTFHCRAAEYARANKMSVEEGARALRYGFFRQAAEEFGADKVALAHNQNDCAETVLFHLARGCGLRGLGGILPVRGNLIRPLLCVSRAEIEDYLEKAGQGFCVDETNLELEYARNKIRHQAIAPLEEVNAQAVSHIARTSFLAAEAADYMEAQAGLAKKRWASREGGALRIADGILGEEAVIWKMALWMALGEASGSSRDISEVHIRQVAGLFGRQVGRRLDLPYGVEAERTYGGILLRQKKCGGTDRKESPGGLSGLRKEPPEGQSGPREEPPGGGRAWDIEPEGVLEIPAYGCRVRTRLLRDFGTATLSGCPAAESAPAEGDLKWADSITEKPESELLQNFSEIPKKKYTKWLDYDKILGVMQLRNRQEGDAIVIDSEGRRKKLGRYLIDEKVPRQERGSVLVLADGSHVIWVVGRRIGEDVKVTEETKRILEIQIDGGTFHE